jgi:MarR family 2-MHQ and catechol resistance regulon transcriptional repressor
VNAIGPKVYLHPGSVSVAVDRLYRKGFVSRVECGEDRRVRTVSLTEKGRRMFVPLFRRHAALIKSAFQDLPSEEPVWNPRFSHRTAESSLGQIRS